MLEEGLECDSHVLILVLFAQFVTQLADAVLFELRIHRLLQDAARTEYLVRVRSRSLLPVHLCLLDDMLAHHVDSLVVLHQNVALVCFVCRSHQDQLLAQLIKFKRFDRLSSTLAACLTDCFHFL